MSTPTPQPRDAIIGGGISGLLTAYKLAKAGHGVDLYEASSRAGGNIESREIDGKVVNAKAEFIDKSQTAIIDLVDELKKRGHDLNLIPATDQSTIRFQTPGGKIVQEEEFLKQALPIQQKITQDKLELAANPNGERAQHLHKLSLEIYLKELNGEALPADSTLGRYMANIGGLLRRKEVPSEVIETMGGGYASESGRDAKNVSAVQFINEAAATPGQWIASGCDYRVEGGTEKIVHALESELKSMGVTIHKNAPVTSVSKDEDGKFAIEAANTPKAAPYDNVVAATTMHALANIKGAESLGLTAEELSFMREAQYTHNAKFTIKTKQPLTDETFISGNGYQTWRSSPDTLTFLVGGEKANSLKGRELVDHMLDAYAKAHGSTADALFDKEKVVFRGPSRQPCYASPGAGQSPQFDKLGAAAERLSYDGVGLAGSYIPSATPEGKGIGFMENGVQSANLAAQRIIDRTKELEQERANASRFVEAYLQKKSSREQSAVVIP